jgi:hypothetical protein
MVQPQHRPGIRTVNARQPELRGANVAAMVIADLGPNHVGDLRVCADEATFWRTYFPSITIGDETIPLGENTLPLPEVLTRWLLERPGSPMRALEQVLAWVRNGASPSDLLAFAHALQAR